MEGEEQRAWQLIASRASRIGARLTVIGLALAASVFFDGAVSDLQTEIQALPAPVTWSFHLGGLQVATLVIGDSYLNLDRLLLWSSVLMFLVAILMLWRAHSDLRWTANLAFRGSSSDHIAQSLRFEFG